jgi:phasin family protein
MVPVSVAPRTAVAMPGSAGPVAGPAAGVAGKAFSRSGNMEGAMKNAEQLMTFGQGNLEAMMKSGQILAAGMQDMAREFAARAQASFEEGMNSFRALSTVKSLKEAVDLQTGFARTAIEKAMAESGRLAEQSLKLVEQASAPLSARMTAAAEALRA